MIGTKPKRFWTKARVAPLADGFGILLDDRQIRTPGRQVLAVPSLALAEAIVAEWDSQGEVIRPESLVLTRMVNTALDQMPTKRGEVIEELTRYGASDLLCYRAEGPAKLRDAQALEWDPPLAWLRARHDITLACTAGVMPVDQPEAGAKFPEILASHSDFALVGLSEMTSISGSLVLALAAAEGWASPEDLFERSRLDERIQADDWGEDEEAISRAASRKDGFVSACSLILLGRDA